MYVCCVLAGSSWVKYIYTYMYCMYVWKYRRKPRPGEKQCVWNSSNAVFTLPRNCVFTLPRNCFKKRKKKHSLSDLWSVINCDGYHNAMNLIFLIGENLWCDSAKGSGPMLITFYDELCVCNVEIPLKWNKMVGIIALWWC